MECKAPLIYAYLLLPGLDPDEACLGQLLTILTALSTLAVLWVVVVLLSKV